MTKTSSTEPVLTRRALLKLGGVSAVAGGLSSLGHLAQAQSQDSVPNTPASESLMPKLNDDFAYTWLTALGMTQYGSADIGELFNVARVLERGDAKAGFEAFVALAQKLEGVADACRAKGHRVSAKSTYLRASAYYAHALDFIDAAGISEKLVPTWERHRTSFDEAVALFTPKVEHIEIPYEDKTLPGYFFKVDDSATPRPLLILNNGSDGSVLSMWTQGGAAAIERGYNALIFDGPGQGAALFRQRLYFRPDWEKVVTPVVDYALTRPEVDARRVALQGVSQGGYWVPRAVAFEHRIAAAVADPGVFDVATSWTGNLPKALLELLQSGNKQMFDRYLSEGLAQDPGAKATLAFRMRPFGVDSYYDAYKAVEAYTLKGVVKQIRCPLLVTAPASDQFWPGQSEELYAALSSPKTLVPFTEADGSDLHCEVQALATRDQRVFDWLDETLSLTSDTEVSPA